MRSVVHRRLAVGIAAVALVAITPGAVAARAATDRTAGPARAANGTGPVTVTVEAMTPTTGADDVTLTLRGRIGYTGTTPIPDLQLLVGVGPVPTTRGELLADFASPPGLSRVLPGCTGCDIGPLAPGGSATYSLSLPLGHQLDRGVEDVYPLVVRAVGAGGGLGQATTFLPYVPNPVSGPLRVSWLVPLDPAPVQASDGTIAAGGFPQALAPSGALGSLLAAGTAPTGTRPTTAGQPGYAPVTWAIEPSLLGAATEASRSGWRRSGDAATGAGRGADPGATTFVRDLTEVTRGTGVLALPYADPDAEAVTRAGQGLDLTTAIATGRAEVRSALPAATVLGDVAWVPGDGVDLGTLGAYAGGGITTLVLPGQQVPPTPDAFPPTQSAVTTLPTQGPAVTGLATDPDLEALLAGGGHDQPTAGMSAERVLALLAFILAELPNSQPSRDVVLALPRGVTPSGSWLRALLTATGSAGWLRAVPLAALRGDGAGDRQPLAAYPSQAHAAELPDTTFTAAGTGVAALHGAVAALDATLPDTTLTRPLDRALLRSESFAWRADPAGGSLLRSGVRASTGAVLDQIRLAAASTVTLASRHSSIPVTVENALAETATVRLTLAAADPTKLATTSQQVVVPAGRKLRVLLVATTQRAGTFRATVTITTPTGLMITQTPIDIHSRAYGAVSFAITFGALGVLLLAIVVRTARRLRAHRRARAA